MDRIELKFMGVSEIMSTDKIGLIVLADMDETRDISVMCDRSMVDQILLRVKNVERTSHLLPEVLVNVLQNQTMLDFMLVFSDVIDGEYQVTLYNRASLVPVRMRASDAVLLHVISKIPIYIERGLFMRQSAPYEASNTKVAIPLNTLSEDLLKAALEDAIAHEQYEMASTLRDEINRRFPQQKKSNEDNKQ